MKLTRTQTETKRMMNEMSYQVYDLLEPSKADRRPRQVHWRKGINRIVTALSCTLVALLVAFFPTVATAQTQPETIAENQSRRERGNQVINELSGGVGQPVLNALRQDFPFLADAITDTNLNCI
ncbi:hypothetical protein H6F95_16405 [Cyanobacteria bacterium FACHB-471]|nr:hypothetical protein [Cyanobacteria bacterium FACHB-471]